MAEEEEKIYVSGKISFIKDDPGRQVRYQNTSISEPRGLSSLTFGVANRLVQPPHRGRLDGDGLRRQHRPALPGHRRR